MNPRISLRRNGTPLKRPSGSFFFAAARARRPNHGIELAVVALDALDGGVDELDGLHFLVLHEPGEAKPVIRRVLRERHMLPLLIR
jgi:hypothetical protein